MIIDTVSVKVMRSFDYCHFEVAMTAKTSPGDQPTDEIDELRKECARLVDRAVDQYKIAKRNFELLMQDAIQMERLNLRAKDIAAAPECDRTPQDSALLKAVQDRFYRIRDRYNYQEDWDESPEWGDADDGGNF